MFKLIQSFCKTQKEQSSLSVSKQANTKLIPVLTAKTLLSSDDYQQQLCEIKQQISVTTEDYERLFLPLINNVAEFMQQLPAILTTNSKDLSKTLFSESFTQAINTLKIRRGYMLPIGADTETCYAQQNSWTYALLVASLLQESWQVIAQYQIDIFDKENKSLGRWHPLIVSTLPIGHFYQYALKEVSQEQRVWNGLLAKSLIPDYGLQWLCENNSLIENLFSHLNGCSDEQDPLTLIIQQAKNNKTDVEHAQKSSVTPHEDNIESSIDKKESFQSDNAGAVAKQPLENLEQKKINIPDALASVSEHKNITTLFLEWITQQIKTSYIATDDKNAIFYRIEYGIMVALPTALNLFQATVSEAKHITEKEFIKILSDADVIHFNAEKNTYLYRYFKGEWKTREIIQGILLKDEHLSEVKEQPPLCTDLQPYLF